MTGRSHLLFSSPMSVKTVINTLYANLALKKTTIFLSNFQFFEDTSLDEVKNYKAEKLYVWQLT